LIFIKHLFKILLPLFFIFIFLLGFWFLKLNGEINTKTAEGWFPPAVEIYAEGETIYKGSTLSKNQLNNILLGSQFTQKNDTNKREKIFKVIRKDECLFNLNSLTESDTNFDGDLINNCFFITIDKKNKLIITLNIADQISDIYLNNQPTNKFELPSFLIAQYFKDKPYLRTNIAIGDAPLQCLQAITAVEDNQFLNHSGISLRGIARAFIKNLKSGASAEGASTITQQLIKNYFLTPERTYKRKIKEIFMAILLELKVNKDQILSNYLNVIYMGQSGPFQIRGYSAAAKYYFQKNISKLNLQECALLATIVNSPGRYNPFTKPDNALKRREKVLTHMLEDQHISEQQFKTANSSPLPTKPNFLGSKSSSYYLDAVAKELVKLDLDQSEGLKLYTSMSPFRQIQAQKSVLTALEKLEKNNKNLKAKNIKLQGSLINIDISTGEIKALIGGRNFQNSQYNRSLEAKRQVGSIMKPFVYIAALENTDPEGKPYNALTQLPDKLQTFKYEGQSWTPKNYSRTYQGRVPLFYALKNSLNSPTASLGMELGIDTVVEVSKRLGVKSELKKLPSITLGAIELKQIELAQSYINIANQGKEMPLRFINRVTDLADNELFNRPQSKEGKQLIQPDVSAQIISILQQTALTGTARSLKTWRGFIHPIAGKTGTTNNTKDAWFVGFTPDTLTLVWVGHDKNIPTGLTGSSGALPIWASYMKKILPIFPMNNNFKVPDNLKLYLFEPEDITGLIPAAKDFEITNTEIALPKNLNFKFKRQLFEETF